MRNNQEKVIKLPLGAEMLACTYGFGTDSHIYVVLAFIARKEGEPEAADQFVTWRGNSQIDGISVAEGNYMPRFEKLESEWVQKAWENFEKRSRPLYQMVPQWIKHERDATLVK